MRRLALGLVGLVAVVALATPALAQDATTVKVKMRDGVELATDVYLPTNDGTKRGTVLVRTPYSRKGGMAKQIAAAGAMGGVNVVIQDDRGRFDSGGEKLPFAGSGWGDRGDDGADTIAWIVKQPWSNGKVVTYGASALGIVQNFTAAARPAGLCAQWIEVAAASLYDDAAYVGGIFREEQARVWNQKNQFDARAVPLMLEHPFKDEHWQLYDTTTQASKMNCPATHVGGWFDTFVTGTIASWKTRQEQGDEGARGNQRLIIGPWTHGGRFRTKQGEIELPPSSKTPGSVGDPIRWFRHWLDGAANGVEQDPPVTYYVLGADEWRTAKTWPPVATKPRRALLASDGTLALDGTAPAKAPTRRFAHDPKNPIETRGGRNLTIPAGPMDQRPIEERKDVITWTSAALEQPVEVIGSVSAEIWVSSSATDVDVHVRVTDVLPDGRSMLVLDGARRASLREGFSVARSLEPGKPVLVPVDLGPIAVSFAKGHRIRVSVSGSNAPRYAVQPLASENEVLGDSAHPSALVLPVTVTRKIWW